MRLHRELLSLITILSLNTAYAANPIIVISIDGLRPDAIEKAKAENLLKLIEGGTYFDNATTVRPSITLPSHTSMLTGLDPKQHGIVWNDYIEEMGPVKFKTALEIANDSGLHTAMIVSKDKFYQLKRPNAVDHFEKTDKSGEDVAEAFEEYVDDKGLPDVTFLHLPDPDKMGHFLVWMSPFYLKGVRDADEALGDILAVANRASGDAEPTIIVTADHGGCGFGHLLDIPENNNIPFIAHGENIAQGLVKHDSVRVYDTAATILDLLGMPIPDNWLGSPVAIHQ